MTRCDSSLCVSLLAAVPYHFHLQSRNQQLARHLAARGLPVRYVAPPTPRAMLRHWSRPWRERRAGAVELIWPLPTPPVRWQAALRLTDRIGHLQARWIGPQLCTDRPHVLCVTTPAWVPLLPFLRVDRIVYDCLDDPLVHARRTNRDLFTAWHRRLCERSDLVVAVSEHLAAELRRLTSAPVLVCGNGVDLEAFSKPAALRPASGAPSAPLSPTVVRWLGFRRANPQARVAGFLGSVDRWVDTALLAQAASALPQVQFVVAGPVRYRELEAPLTGLANVHLLGWIPYAAAAAVIDTFDVGLIPFAPGAIAACADPLKVYEYCALGKPVVASVQFSLDDTGAPLTTAPGPAAFAAAIEAAIADDSAQLQAERVAFAQRHTWQARAEEFCAALANIVGPRAL